MRERLIALPVRRVPETEIFKLSPVARAYPGQILLGLIFIVVAVGLTVRAVDQRGLQRLLGYGTIKVLADDDTTPEVNLAGVSRPMKVKEMIRTHYRAARHREGVHPTEFMQSP